MNDTANKTHYQVLIINQLIVYCCMQENTKRCNTAQRKARKDKWGQVNTSSRKSD